MAGGCFGEAPSVDVEASTASDEGSSASATGNTSASSSVSAPGTMTDGSSEEGSTSTTGRDPDSSSSDEGPSEVEAATDTPIVCECPDGALWCETFDPPFTPDGGGWGVPGGTAPQPTDTPTRCGEGALRAAVEMGELYSVVTGELPVETAEPGIHTVTVWIWVGEGCLGASTRLVQVRHFTAGELIQFGAEVHADADTVTLSLLGLGSVGEAFAVGHALTPETWTEIELTLEVSTTEATEVSLRIDGATLHDGVEAPGSGAVPAVEAILNLGVYRAGAQFDAACTAVYDDASAT